MSCRSVGTSLHGPALAVPCPADVQHQHELSSLALKQSLSHTVDTVPPARQATLLRHDKYCFKYAEVTDTSHLEQIVHWICSR